MNKRLTAAIVPISICAAVLAQDPPNIAPAAEEATGVVATVNGQPIYYEDVERRLGSMHSGLSETSRGTFDLDRLVQELVNDELLVQEARALDLDQDPTIVARVDSYRRQLTVERFEDEEIDRRVEVSEEQLREAFRRDYATVDLLMLTVDERERADELLAELRNGADFGALAREHSIDPYSGRGGKIEKIARIDMPAELAKEAWNAEPGQLTGPIRTNLGWSVVRVEALADADPERFDALRPKIESTVRFRETERLRSSLARALRETFDVSIDSEVVDAIGCQRLTDGRLMPEVQDPKAVVARIGERTVTAEQLALALKSRWRGVRSEEAALATRRIILQAIVQQELMDAEALRRGYADRPETLRAAHALEKQLVVQRYLESIVAPKVEVTDEEVEGLYEERLDDFRQPPRVSVGQITVKTKEEAERIADLLRQGTDLAWLARQHSVDRFRDGGGDRGWMVPIRGIDPLQDQLTTAPAGEVIGPLGAPDNWVVLRVAAREDQGVRPLGEVREGLRSELFQRKFAEFLEDHLREMRDRSEIVVDEEVLAALRITGSPVEDETTTAPPAPHGMPQGE